VRSRTRVRSKRRIVRALALGRRDRWERTCGICERRKPCEVSLTGTPVPRYART